LLGEAITQGESGTLDTQRVSVWQPFRNAAQSCVLMLPTEVALAPEGRASQAFPVRIRPPAQVTVAAGQSGQINIVASWRLPGSGEDRSALPCADLLNDISGIEVPLAAGRISIRLTYSWKEVCSNDPPSIGVTLDE